MARCEWAILCDYAFQDQGGKMCIIGMFDRIMTNAVPASHHQAAVVLRLVGEPQERVRIRIDVVRPNNDLLGRVEGEGQLADAGTVNLNLGLRGLPLPDFGIYAFNVFVGDQLDKTIGLTVTRPPQQPQSA